MQRLRESNTVLANRRRAEISNRYAACVLCSFNPLNAMMFYISVFMQSLHLHSHPCNTYNT